MWGNFWLAENLLASPEGLCTTEWLCKYATRGPTCRITRPAAIFVSYLDTTIITQLQYRRFVIPLTDIFPRAPRKPAQIKGMGHCHKNGKRWIFYRRKHSNENNWIANSWTVCITKQGITSKHCLFKPYVTKISNS